MLAWLNLKRHNFLRLNFKFHGANPLIKAHAAKAVKFKILIRQDGILRAKIKRQER